MAEDSIALRDLPIMPTGTVAVDDLLVVFDDSEQITAQVRVGDLVVSSEDGYEATNKLGFVSGLTGAEVFRINQSDDAGDDSDDVFVNAADVLEYVQDNIEFPDAPTPDPVLGNVVSYVYVAKSPNETVPDTTTYGTITGFVLALTVPTGGGVYAFDFEFWSNLRNDRPQYWRIERRTNGSGAWSVVFPENNTVSSQKRYQTTDTSGSFRFCRTSAIATLAANDYEYRVTVANSSGSQFAEFWNCTGKAVRLA